MEAIQRPRGTNDVLPEEAGRWQALEAEARRVAHTFGYREIRTPILEHTELFTRGVGEASEVVHKQMYTFTDQGGRLLTLRPEGTAPVARAYVEHGMQHRPQPVKVFYLAPMFRYEKPQAGRYRQHQQFGVEAFGSPSPAVDAEVILLAAEFLRRLGLDRLHVALNSIGCPACRPGYVRALRAYFEPRLQELCPDCRGHRFEANPLRILDCKEAGCRAAIAGAPRSMDALCNECLEHFHALQANLAAAGFAFAFDPTLVRGFDYYTKTVFEIIFTGLGAQAAVCGGGRYDGLVEAVGGPPTPGVGFGMGLERVLLTLEQQGRLPDGQVGVGVFLAVLGPAAERAAVPLCHRLRQAGIAADMNYLDRKLGAQLRAADRAGARLALILGDAELEKGVVVVRDMAEQTQEEVPLDQVVARVGAALGAGPA